MLLASLLSSLLMFQQPSTIVAGRVVAGSPPAPVAGASVTSGTSTATTDSDGRFSLTLTGTTPATVRVTVKARGFAEAQADAVIENGRADLAITLQPTPGYREEVTVGGITAPVASPPSTIEVTPKTVTNVAGALDNIYRVLQTLPGVSAADDFGSRLSVRGGGPDENLTIMDGVEIHDPYRLFGFASAFNPETIDHFELTAGGFGVSHGDRLSSILQVDNRAGSSARDFGGSASLSITDANIVTEGKLPSGSWLLTGRRTYYDIVAEKITDTQLPSFADMQTKVAWNLPHGRKLSIFGLRSRELTDARFHDDGSDERFGLKDRAKNDVAGATFTAPIGARATSRTIAAWYRYDDQLSADATFQTDAIRSNRPGDDALARTSFGFSRDLIVRDISLRHEITAQAGSRHTISTGGEWHALRTTWNSTIAGDRNPTEANGSSVQGGSALPDRVDSSADSARAAAWLEDDLPVSSRLRVAGGIRIDWSRLAREAVLSPRVRATFTLSSVTRLRVATGLYTQSPGYEKLLQADYFVNLTDSSTPGLKSERAVHLIGGIEQDLGPAMQVRLEGYYKRFSEMVSGRLETPEETEARIAQYAFPIELGGITNTPQITTIPGNFGKGRAYGMDVYLEKRDRSAHDRLSGWVSYTFGRVTADNYGVSYPFDYDRRHSLSVVSTWRATSKLAIGSTLRLSSGFPYTPPLGVHVATTLASDTIAGAPASLVPRVDSKGYVMWTIDYGGVDNLNRGRLPVYARLDLRFTYQRSTASRWQIYAELLNSLNRQNASTMTPVLEYNPVGDRPRIRLKPDEGLPRLPTVGFRIRF